MAIAVRLPAIFFRHGDPMNALADSHYTQAWRRIGESIGSRARCCAFGALVHGGHRIDGDERAQAMSAPRTIHDFGGFPRARAVRFESQAMLRNHRRC